MNIEVDGRPLLLAEAEMAEDDFLVRRQRQLLKQAERETFASRRNEALRVLAGCIVRMRAIGLPDDQIAWELRDAAKGLESKL